MVPSCGDMGAHPDDPQITVYDALFIVAALRSGDDLVTCDDQQAVVARAMGVKVRTAY